MKEYETYPVAPYILIEMEPIESESGIIVATDIKKAATSGVALPKVKRLPYVEGGSNRGYKVGDYILVRPGGADGRNLIPAKPVESREYLIDEKHVVCKVEVTDKESN